MREQHVLITLFGATGDLAHRKLYPAIFRLFQKGFIKNHFAVIGTARREWTDDYFRDVVKQSVQSLVKSEEELNEFLSHFYYQPHNVNDTHHYVVLKELSERLDGTYQINGNRVFYLAMAPNFFGTITEHLKAEQLLTPNGYNRLIIEKPFGKDFASAQELNHQLRQSFDENQIYRIDHYLGKEMIQNILSLRFKNIIFKGVWNKDFIENVQITAAEAVGVGTRASYYDKSGAVKDMVQNHLLQVLSIVAMEEPKEEGSRGIHDSQYNLLSKLVPITNVNDSLVMAQYEGYLDEENISKDSKTETYAALKLFIDNERWQGVPFFIRTGKKMGDRETQVVVQFKAVGDIPGNVLIIKIQPDEGVYFQFNAKKPGTEQELQQISLDFCQSCILENRINTPEAYERLLDACFKDDRSLFSQWNQIVASWTFVNDLLEKYHEQGAPLYTYKQGSMGPKEADEFVDWIK